VAPTNKEATGPLREREYQGVITDITITPKDIPIGEHIEAQFLPFLGNIGGPVWMNLKEK
jgi:hypothetical protein